MKASLGTLLPGNQLKVTDPDTGAVKQVGEDGEFLIKGPTLMLGYLGKPESETFDADGWFHTGDVGHIDDEGGVHWSGRRNEVIRTGGAMVSPAEIEVALRAYPPVKLARVIGMPGPDDITGFLRERVAAYKVPKKVLFFAPGEIPLTASATKVRDDELRTLVSARLDGAS